jgi:hypothetical protein
VLLADTPPVPAFRPVRDADQAPVETGTGSAQVADRQAPAPTADPTGAVSSPGGRTAVAPSPNLAALRSTGSSTVGNAEEGSVIVATPASVNGAVTTTTVISPTAVLAGKTSVALALGAWAWGPLMSPLSVDPHAFAILSAPSVGLPAGSTSAPILVAGREAGPAVDELQTLPAEEAPFEAPPPVGAGLITQFLPFDLGSLDEPVSRFLDGLANETVAGVGDKAALPYTVLWVTAGLAFELTRRWHRHLASPRAMGDWKKVSRTLHGLS